MLPERIIKKVVGCLMAAYHECRPFDPETADLTTVMFYSSNHNQFGLNGSWRTTLKELAAKCNVWLDQYPLQEFQQFLQTAVADAKEAAASGAETSALFRSKLEGFFKSIGDSPEWEVVLAVFGLAATQPPFSLGPCRFFIMDEAEVNRWAQRRRCGRYDPPPDTVPFHDRLGLGRQLLGNWVACLRVRAIDTNHAMAKAEYRLEEVLNLLRHGAFFFGIPQQCVRAGLGHPHYWNNQSMCIRVYPPGGFQDSAGEGANGLTIDACSHVSSAWTPLQTVVAKESTARTSLETTVMTALEWVGQAAAAPLGPVRLVSLVTALEVLVLLESEALGKRSKLSKRVARIVQTMQPDAEGVEQTADRLYRVRSECLHEGATQVEDDDIKTAYGFVDAIITAFLTKNPFCKCDSLGKVLDSIREPERADAERDALVAETVASQADQERKKEIQTMTSKWGPTLFEKALAQGKAEGEAKGKAEGQLVNARVSLRALVENRFGAIPEALAQRIEATADLDRLQAALVQVLHAQSADELLA